MYQVRAHKELQVLCQAVSHLRIIVHYHHMYQNQFHREIQVKHLSKSHQGLLLNLLVVVVVVVVFVVFVVVVDTDHYSVRCF